MKIRDIFDSGFIGTVTATLDAKCVAGETLTRAALCHELGLTETLPELAADASAEDKEAAKEAQARKLAIEAVVGSLITLDVIEGFETRKGPGGGIGKLGERRAPSAKEPGKKGTRNVEFPEGFIDNLSNTLNTLCVDGKCVPRRDVASSMGMPGSDTEALISAALAENGPLAADYKTRRGVGGGICRRPAGETPAPEPTVEGAEASSEPETVIEPGEVLAVEDAEVEVEIEAEAQAEPEAASEEPAAVEPAEGEVVKAKRSRKPRAGK